ncbi:MAG TPA: tripartite tricarboxylate transporter TctB family protein [Thermodesulfobacteriota bacterium]|nr:tripartite tricarboxylate transporter TctB family protein [Thermodesulfobacteriota bacterium]
MKTLRPVDIGVGCFLALLGIFILYASSMIRTGVERSLSPRTIPSTLGFLILFCGIGLAVKSWRFRGEDPKINWPDRLGIKIILVNLISLAFYIVLMNPLGLPLSTFLYVTFSTWYLKRSKWVTAIVMGLIFGVVSYYVFIRLLGLSFPEGVLFEG